MVKRCKTKATAIEEEPPARLVPPPAHTRYVNPMDLNGHRLYYAAVLHKTGRDHEGHIIFCSRCGAYFWKRALALLQLCGSRHSDSGGMSDQLQRIGRSLFPSPSPKYGHLVLDKACRLSGPHAAMVQGQLETISGTPFAGARAPLMRMRLKSPDIMLQEFPLARPSPALLRAQILAAYGVSDTLLEKLIQFQQARMDARRVRRAFEEATQDDSDYDDL